MTTSPIVPPTTPPITTTKSRPSPSGSSTGRVAVITGVLVVAGLVALAGLGWWLLFGRTAARHGQAPDGAPGATTADRAAAATGDAPGGGGERPVSVTTTLVGRRDVPLYLEGIGSVVPLQTVMVKPQVDGRLDKAAFEEGKAVRKGDLLAQIDPRPFAIQRDQAQAALARDTAQTQSSRLTLQRYEKVRQENLIAQQQLDDQRALVAQQEATLKADQAQLDQARLQLDYARIRSPIDGVTGVRLVDPGNIIRASDPTGIVMVTQLDPIAVLFSLPQDELPRIAEQMAGGPLQVDVLSRDGATTLGSGKLGLIDNQINQTTATIRLKAVLENPRKTLWPNQFVKVRLLLAVRKQALVLPAAAIQRGPQGTFVYLVGADQRAATRPVKVDSVEGDTAIVAGGLQQGDQVVTEGQGQLRPGARVAARLAVAGTGAGGGSRPTGAGGGGTDGGGGGGKHAGSAAASRAPR
ncbi:MAG: efflux RND transporter periplasmic adaptor subunit [Polyangia bacterium]